MTPIFHPGAKALGQLDDPVFLGVVFRSVLWSIALFAALHVIAIWGIHRILAFHGWSGWLVDIIGSIGVSFLTLWLFLPVAAGIGTLYFERVASAVEMRYYPWLPRFRAAPVLEQVWDGVSVALKVLALNAVALALALVVPGAGLVLGWTVAGYAIGRGLFVAIAMRRMPRRAAESLYRGNRGSVLLNGCVLAMTAYVPIVNLLLPVIGTAVMVHILDTALTGKSPTRP